MANTLWFMFLWAPLLLPGSASQDTLRVDVELVDVVATVLDSEGHYVTGLDAQDFLIEDSGVAQTISHFTQDKTVPVSLGVVLDTSASMLYRIQTALAAVERFLATLLPDDDVFIATFANDVHVIQDMSSNRTQLSRALLKARPRGGTSLYDAVVSGVETVSRGRHSKRALLLLTDGADTASGLGLRDAIHAIEGSNVLVYALAIDPMQFAEPVEHVRFELPGPIIPGAGNLSSNGSNEQPVRMKVLEDFAKVSGGQAYRVRHTWTGGTDDDIDPLLGEVSAQLRSQYSIGYYPSTPLDGRRHTIRVRVRGQDDYTVYARSGYLARSANPSEN